MKYLLLMNLPLHYRINIKPILIKHAEYFGQPLSESVIQIGHLLQEVRRFNPLRINKLS